jgi:hypothetical protein
MNVTAVSPMAKRSEDFTALQSTLQSGNLAAAQGAFAAFQQDVQTTTHAAGPGSLFAPGTQTATDLATLGSALKSANLTGAQKAFATLQQDIQTARGSGNAASVGHVHRPLTQAEIANNGAPMIQTGVLGSSAARAVGSILNSQA